jgi:hypothetical protein
MDCLLAEIVLILFLDDGFRKAKTRRGTFGFLNFSQSRERPDTQSPLLSAVAGSPRRMTSFAEARAYGEGHGKRSA